MPSRSRRSNPASQLEAATAHNEPATSTWLRPGYSTRNLPSLRSAPQNPRQDSWSRVCAQRRPEAAERVRRTGPGERTSSCDRGDRRVPAGLTFSSARPLLAAGTGADVGKHQSPLGAGAGGSWSAGFPPRWRWRHEPGPGGLVCMTCRLHAVSVTSGQAAPSAARGRRTDLVRTG